MIAESAKMQVAVREAVRAPSARYEFVKRTVDIVLTFFLLLAAALIMLAVAVAIKIDSRGPVLYRQRRVGEDGHEFYMLKFRSMRVNNDESIHRKAIERFMNGDALSEDDRARFKLAQDPRVTRVGRFIRKTSLDELPQLWNVLRGEMSLVGPRPPLPYEVARYSPQAFLRLEGKPGLTGPWQVYGRSRVTFDEMVEMDIEYLERRSIREDLKLIVMTVPVMLVGNGGG